MILVRHTMSCVMICYSSSRETLSYILGSDRQTNNDENISSLAELIKLQQRTWHRSASHHVDIANMGAYIGPIHSTLCSRGGNNFRTLKRESELSRALKLTR